jgi:chromosome segregation ATPase
MEAQAENLLVPDFLAQLDLALGFIPDAQSADVLRRQFVDACETVERANGRVRTLNAEAEAILNDLKAKQEAFENEKKSEREAISNEKATLRQEQAKLRDEQAQFKKFAESLGSEVQKFSKSADQVSENVKTWSSTVTEASANREAAGRQLTEDIFSKLESLSVNVETNTKDLSLSKDKSAEMATALDSVKDVQEQIKLSLQDGATKEGMKSEFESLAKSAKAITNTIQGLPTVAFLESKFQGVGRIAERADHYAAQSLQLDRDIQVLRDEALELENSTAQQVAQANSRVELATSLREVAESQVKEKDSFINELREGNADLRNRLRQAESEGNAAKRRLEVMDQKLGTAEAKLQEIAEARNKLQRAEQVEREKDERIKELQSALERERKYHDDCSAELTKTLSEKGEVILQKAKLEDEYSSVRKELSQLRSQGALALQQQLKDQWATVKEALEQQLCNKRSHDEGIRELRAAWNTERQALQGQITDKDSLLRRQNDELGTLQSQAALLDQLQQQLQQANDRHETATETLERVKSDLQALKQRLAESEQRLQASDRKLEETKTDNESLRKDWEDALEQVKNSNAVIERKEKEHNATRDMLSTLQAQSVTVPQGVSGELSRMYFRLANELRGIPTVPDINGELEMSVVAVEIGPLLIRYGNSDLLEFLQGGNPGLHCSRQVIQGHRHSITSDGRCNLHDKCLLVRVVVADSPALEFLRAE